MTEDLKRSILLLDAQVRHLQERLRVLEQSGRKISLLPVTILRFFPVLPAYPIADQVLLAVTLEENDTQAPVIMVSKESLRKFLQKPLGVICTLDDYQQTPHVAQKKYVPQQGWVWELPV
jgi:hypothetical protein